MILCAGAVPGDHRDGHPQGPHQAVGTGHPTGGGRRRALDRRPHPRLPGAPLTDWHVLACAGLL